MATPYDGKVAVWLERRLYRRRHDRGPRTNHQDLGAGCDPGLVKTSDGENWQGEFDTDRDMAIDSVASVDKWVRVLEAHGMEFHAWAVVKGRNITAEADRIIEVCNRPGVKSMVLDVEPYAGFWTVGRDPIRPFMTRIRRGIGGRFHLGMAVDPRPQHKPRIYPAEWRPFVNSVHLQLYWETFQRDVEEVLEEGFETWGNYGLPVLPVLPGAAPRRDEHSPQAGHQQV